MEYADDARMITHSEAFALVSDEERTFGPHL